MNPTTYEQLYEAVKEKKIVAAVTKDGEKHRLFISDNGGYLCRFMKKSSRRGYRIATEDFDNFIKFIGAPAPKSEDKKLKQEYNEIAKYKRMAQQATFSNSWIEDCKNLPDFETWKKDLVTNEFERPVTPRPKSLYELHVTTGNKIDGKVISLSRIAKEFPYAVQKFREALKDKKAIGSVLRGERFAGYDISMSLEQKETGELFGYLSLEYKGCGNGYYYLLINDENFIGYDVD